MCAIATVKHANSTTLVRLFLRNESAGMD